MIKEEIWGAGYEYQRSSSKCFQIYSSIIEHYDTNSISLRFRIRRYILRSRIVMLG